VPNWVEGPSCSLSAPIIEVGVEDLISDGRMQQLSTVLEYWTERDRENCDRVRMGLLSFTGPASYLVNEVPNSGMIRMGRIGPSQEQIRRGLRT
jgi:hypothetical protein